MSDPGTIHRLVAVGLRALLGLSIGLASPARADDGWDDDWGEESGPVAVELHGFVEAAAGSRVVEDDARDDDLVLAEARFRLELSHEQDRGRASVKADLVADEIEDDVSIDLREAMAVVQPASWVDVRAGRQVLTWGTGDLLFLNDLFPKDFVSFFAGRDDEYLKAPSTALKLGLFSGIANLDLVWTPVFESDRILTGERISVFDPGLGAPRGPDAALDPLEPDRSFENGEWAARLHRSAGPVELALYGYWGFTKQPAAFDVAAGRPTHSRLAVAGASARGPILGGIANVEGAYRHARDDEDGSDPTVPNSQVRGLVGYEREVVARLTLGVQGYVEWTLDHDALRAASLAPELDPDEVRQVLTTRFTYLALRDDLVLSLFVFVSPGDEDAHLRPTVAYKLSDAIRLTAGANVMVGEAPHTFFGQLEDATNVYARARYSF